MTDDPMLACWLSFIFVTVMLDRLALGMIIPVVPELMKRFRGGDTAGASRASSGPANLR
jgi:hypothetical protein